MRYSEDDIDFNKISSSSQFEELCFDLLLKLNFSNLIWRQGGADSGRDIEGLYTNNNSLINTFQEKWFFECKYSMSGGISNEKLRSKIQWADSDKPQHVVIITNSYITNNCRTWISKIQTQKAYLIHVIEGKRLKELILKYPDLVQKYFADEYYKLLYDCQKNWLIHTILPDPTLLNLLTSNLDFNKANKEELAFIWSVFQGKCHELSNWFENNDLFSFDFIFDYLKQNKSDINNSVLKNIEFISGAHHSGQHDYSDYKYQLFSYIHIIKNGRKIKAMYSLAGNKTEGIEVLIEASSNFNTQIRYISTNVIPLIRKQNHLLVDKFDINTLAILKY